MMTIVSILLVILNMILVFLCIFGAIKTVYYLFRDYRKFVRNLLMTFLLFSMSVLLFSILSSNAELLNIEIIDG